MAMMNDEMDQQMSNNGMIREQTRRGFLRSIGATSVTLAVIGCDGDDDEEVKVNQQWEDMAEQLERNGVFTVEDQGPWEGKAGSHVAMVTPNDDGTFTLTTGHEMTDEHYITTHYIRNQDGIIIGFQQYQPGDDPSVTFTVPRGTTQVTALQYCNKHDAWADADLTA